MAVPIITTTIFGILKTGTILNVSTSHLISLLVVVPLQVVEDGRPHQQVGEGDNDKGQGANLRDVVCLILTNAIYSNQDSFEEKVFLGPSFTLFWLNFDLTENLHFFSSSST